MGFPKTENLSGLIEQFRAAQRKTGKSLVGLLWQAVRLRYGRTAVGFSEFFGYRLYDPVAVPERKVDTFVSDDFQEEIWEKTNPPSLWGQVSDKIFFQLIMERLGFVQPP